MSQALNVLVIGGSGFLSGTLATHAVAAGHRVTVVTRGKRSLPQGVSAITVDRHDHSAFKTAISDSGQHWDLVVDCIAYDPAEARQDIEVFPGLADHLVFVSTDFVFDPAHRIFPQPEITEHYIPGENYGSKKRLCELEFLNGDTGDMVWSVVRPCHIYGPGSQLGCLPEHGRDPELISKIKAGTALKLVGGGHFLQQPILAGDLSALMLSLHGNEKTYGEIFCTAGPDIIESREYYNIIADVLEADHPEIVEIPVSQFLAEKPQSCSFVCHRIYSQAKLEATGARVPATTIYDGLRQHTESLL
jgi:nucleoside-diphosphate-sugar epimerase